MLAPNRLHIVSSLDDGRAVVKAPTLAVFDDDTTRVDLVAHPAGTRPNDTATATVGQASRRRRALRRAQR